MAHTKVRVAGRVLNPKQLAGQACVYCRTTFGAMDPIEPPAEVPGVWFLFAHPHCRQRHE